MFFLRVSKVAKLFGQERRGKEGKGEEGKGKERKGKERNFLVEKVPWVGKEGKGEERNGREGKGEEGEGNGGKRNGITNFSATQNPVPEKKTLCPHFCTS